VSESIIPVVWTPEVVGIVVLPTRVLSRALFEIPGGRDLRNESLAYEPAATASQTQSKSASARNASAFIRQQQEANARAATTVTAGCASSF